MEVTLTAKIRLYPTDADSRLFFEMSEQYRQACNFVSEYLFAHRLFKASAIALSDQLYYTIRDRFNLKAQLAQSVFRTVVARYKTIRTQLAQNPYRYQDASGKWQAIRKDLEWLQKPIAFQRPQADLVRGKDYSLVAGGTRLSVNTLHKRVQVPFQTDAFSDYLDGSWKIGTGKLVHKHGCWFLHVSVSKDVDDVDQTTIKQVVGLDRGLRQLVTVYDDAGKTTFVDGKPIMKKRDTYNRVRGELQSKGTKSAKRRLKKLAQRENRWMSDVNHCLSKTLVDHYGAHTLFVLEDLTGVSFNTEGLPKSQRNKHRNWAFYQFQQFLAYKAQNNTSLVLEVDAAYTSQCCPQCGTIDKSHRDKKRHEYHCTACAYRTNDDRAAAMNIHALSGQWFAGIAKPKLVKV